MRLELTCGATDAPRSHPGWFRPSARDEYLHPKHSRVKALLEAAGISHSITASAGRGVRYSDAYVYFEPSTAETVAGILREAGIAGDILDELDDLTQAERRRMRRIASREGWKVEG